jgi:SAM-dependent methyltransferase
MREFWDERAREDAYYYVDNRQPYGEPDLERFWAGGRDVLSKTLDLLRVEISPDDEIVEIGCGIGRVTRALAERGASVRAIDVSEEMLSLALAENAHLDNVEWILGDGRTLDVLSSESADVCQSHVVFQHAPDPAITLGYVREMARVLRPRGWAAFQVSNAPELHRPGLRRRVRVAIRGLARRGPRGQGHPAWAGSAVALDRLRAVAEGAGASIERVVGEGTQFCLVLMRKMP